jgi:hypothetical protein
MAVYVDNMNAKLGRMCMCHMIADSHEELLSMARRVGVSYRWIQDEGTYREHFDICLAKRKLAIEKGAKVVTMTQLGRMLRQRLTKGMAASA